uniref:Kelch like family member 32 n=1 Tax=Ovis aries TaxID=9940 RepID=A0AC11EBG0_SHEEP
MPSERFLSIQEMLTGQRLCHSESHNDSVLAALNQQRSDGILCDVTLIAEEQKFHAHKAVLAACSDYFRAMFSLCMVESGADEVNLHGVTSLGLKQALEFAYTGQSCARVHNWIVDTEKFEKSEMKGKSLNSINFVGARSDPGCVSSWQSPTVTGASQFMFSLSHPGIK